VLYILHNALVRSIDEAAATRVVDLAQLVAAEHLRGTIPEPREDDIVHVVDASGRILKATPRDANLPPIAEVVPPLGAEPVVQTVTGVRDDDDMENYRVWAVRAKSEKQGPVTVYLGVSLESVADTVRSVAIAMTLGFPVLLGLLAFSTWLLIGRALRPVEVIRADVAEISATDLDRRVTVPPTEDEIGRLARTMNSTLDRLHTASEKQRIFVADASHELQSPLTSFRTQLEVALAHPAEADWQATGKRLLSETQHLERLVRDLLFLARAEATPGRKDELVDLDDIVLEEAARLRLSTDARVDTSEVSAAPVRGNRDELVRMARNLLENAARHAASTVRIELGLGDDGTKLVIHDDGPGVPPDKRQNIFDRFVRLDGARTRGDGGTGLGLAIVQAIAVRHGGAVSVDDGVGARFVVRLPPTDVSH
jgi:signal transduction histidine kinase